MSYIPWRLEGGDMDDFDYYITVKDENRMVRDKSHKKKIILKEKEKNIITVMSAKCKLLKTKNKHSILSNSLDNSKMIDSRNY